jgi:hypothetical protein
MSIGVKHEYTQYRQDGLANDEGEAMRAAHAQGLIASSAGEL